MKKTLTQKTDDLERRYNNFKNNIFYLLGINILFFLCLLLSSILDSVLMLIFTMVIFVYGFILKIIFFKRWLKNA